MNPTHEHELVARTIIPRRLFAAIELRPLRVELVADRTLKAATLVDVLSEFRHLDIGTLSLVTVREGPQ